LQQYFGVDVTPYKKDLGILMESACWLRWSHTWMGSQPSPYNAVLFYYLAEEFIWGNSSDQSNPFVRDKLVLNFPGSVTFDPTQPNVIKWDSTKNWITCDLVVFVG
jgi:hypothetical protein